MIVQWYRYQHIRKAQFPLGDVLTHQVTQNPAGRQLALEFEYLYQAVHWKLILQRVNRAKKRWLFMNTGTANFIPG